MAVVLGVIAVDLVFQEGGNATTLWLDTATTEIFTGVAYPGATDGTPPDIPIAHTQLTMTSPLAGKLSHPHYSIHSGHIVHESHSSIIKNLIIPSEVAVRFEMQDVGTLIGTARTTLTA